MMEDSPKTQQAERSSEVADSFWIPLFLGLLLTWRWIMPIESAILGETLWISQISLVLPIFCAVWFWRQRSASIVWSRWDACLWLVVIGHWCSLFWLFKTGGQLRSAFNLCWEWTAIGCTFFALRQSVRSNESRSDLIRLLMIVGLCMAGLGLWQHFVSYRWVLADYQSVQQEYDGLIEKANSRGLSRLEQEQLRSLQAEYQAMNIPLDGSSREMFERRLADNRQPVGRWALTNSLGGLLAILCVLLVAAVMFGYGRRWVTMILLTLVLVCLWATHSRTAQVATCIGVLLLALERWAPKSRIRILRMGFLTSVVLVGGIAILWGINGLDQIEFESNFALRSLQFRLQYWVGSLQALFDAPLFGTGPGNFRQVYLQYKLPASSEQIADPHNALLDVWANGGILGLLAVVTACGLFLKQFCVASPVNETSTTRVPFIGWLSSPWMLGAEIALVGAFLVELITSGYADKELIAFAFALPVLDVSLKTLSTNLPTNVLMIGAIVLGIHLMGAGGMEMPGMVLIGLCLIAVVMSTEAACCSVSRSKQFGLVASGLMLGFAMWFTTTAPVRNAEEFMQSAQRDMYAGGRIALARQTFFKATEADPYDPEPWRSWGEFEFALWQADTENVTFLENAHDAWKQASTRDPRSYRDSFHRAEAYWHAFQQLERLDYAVQAEKLYAQADEKMPHDERILSGWALSAREADLEEKSRLAAKKAIEIHELSRKNGHWEKMLSEERVEQLEQILAIPD